MLSIEKTVRLVISLVAVAVIAGLLSLTTTQVGAQIYNMDRDYNDPYVEKPGPEDDSGPQKPRPPLPIASPYSSPAPTKDPSGCVVAGCSGTLCVEASDPRFATTCEYLPKYQCYNDLTCTRLESGDCGFQEQDQLQQCLAEYEDGDDDDEDDQTTPNPEYSFFQRLPDELRDTATELDFGGSAIELELDETATYVDVSEFELNDTDPAIAPIQILRFTTPGELNREVQFLAEEVDYDDEGSYIFTAYYDSEGRLLNPPSKRYYGTRIQFEANENTEYYAIVGAFGNQEGTARLSVGLSDSYPLQPIIQRPNIDDSFVDIDEIASIGRVGVFFGFEAPRFRDINNESNTFSWARFIDSSSGNGIFGTKKVWIEEQCATAEGDLTLGVGNRIEPDVLQLGSLEGIISSIMVTPPSTTDSRASFPPGRDYLIVGQDISADNTTALSADDYVGDPEVLASFSTTSRNIYDLTGDGIIDISDYSILISEYLDETRVLAADYNCDDVVDIEDYSQLIRRYSGGDYAVTE